MSRPLDEPSPDVKWLPFYQMKIVGRSPLLEGSNFASGRPSDEGPEIEGPLSQLRQAIVDSLQDDSFAFRFNTAGELEFCHRHGEQAGVVDIGSARRYELIRGVLEALRLDPAPPAFVTPVDPVDQQTTKQKQTGVIHRQIHRLHTHVQQQFEQLQRWIQQQLDRDEFAVAIAGWLEARPKPISRQPLGQPRPVWRTPTGPAPFQLLIGSDGRLMVRFPIVVRKILSVEPIDLNTTAAAPLDDGILICVRKLTAAYLVRWR